jgi:hypothetical protein
MSLSSLGQDERCYFGEYYRNPRAGRTAALRELILQAPAPVVAQALAHHHNTTTRVATEAATPWSRYASGDHSRWSST